MSVYVYVCVPTVRILNQDFPGSPVVKTPRFQRSRRGFDPRDCNPLSLSVGFSRQEYWSGLTFPSPGNLPDAGIEPESPALQANSLPSEPPGRPQEC